MKESSPSCIFIIFFLLFNSGSFRSNDEALTLRVSVNLLLSFSLDYGSWSISQHFFLTNHWIHEWNGSSRQTPSLGSNWGVNFSGHFFIRVGSLHDQIIICWSITVSFPEVVVHEGCNVLFRNRSQGFSNGNQRRSGFIRCWWSSDRWSCLSNDRSCFRRHYLELLTDLNLCLVETEINRLLWNMYERRNLNIYQRNNKGVKGDRVVYQ